VKVTKLVGRSLGVAAGMMLVVLPAGAAFAKGGLELKSLGTPVAIGSPGSVGMTIEECGIFSNGKVVSNGGSKDVVTGTASSEAECPEVGETISGLINETQLGKTGKATLKGSITISGPGECGYTFKNPKTTFVPGGFAFLKGTSTGKRTKASSKTCPKTSVQTFFASVTNEVFGEPFEDELIS
jgi:hypothetical protein